MEKPFPICIFDYSDYRKFLRDMYKYAKKQDSAFSFQYLAIKASFKTKTFLYKVMNGEKALPDKSIRKVASAFDLKKRETDYFEALVHFNEAKDYNTRSRFFERMQSFYKEHAATRLRDDQLECFAQWYHAAIREAATLIDFKDDFRILAKSIDPPITPGQAKKSVELLLRLDLLRKTPSGDYIQTHNAITTDGALAALGVHAFQKEMSRLAVESIDRHRRDERDISTLTIGVSKPVFEKISAELADFRKKIVAMVADDKVSDRVYQMNFHLFPLTKLLVPSKTVCSTVKNSSLSDALRENTTGGLSGGAGTTDSAGTDSGHKETV